MKSTTKTEGTPAPRDIQELVTMYSHLDLSSESYELGKMTTTEVEDEIKAGNIIFLAYLETFLSESHHPTVYVTSSIMEETSAVAESIQASERNAKTLDVVRRLVDIILQMMKHASDGNTELLYENQVDYQRLTKNNLEVKIARHLKRAQACLA